MTEYEITTHPDGKQFIRIEDKWMPLGDLVECWDEYSERHISAKENRSRREVQDYEVIRGAYIASHS